ncbi:MAG: ABC transporter permease [Lachnospiraceae bacterium]|nr:ABC transporter permease [Lachnospiraceae bacterium]
MKSFKVKNRNVILQIAGNTYKGGKNRNRLTILAIALTAFLITVVLALGISYWETVSTRTLYMQGMDFDIQLNEPREDQVEKIRSMDKVKYAGVMVKCAILEKYQDQDVHNMRMYWLDDTVWEKQCIPAMEEYWGTYPRAENEIMLSWTALTEMGITDPQIGMKLPVTYYTLKEVEEQISLQKEFVLSGYYRDYSGIDRAYVSADFYAQTGVTQTDFTQGLLVITLKNPLYSKADIIEIQNQIDINRQTIDADYETISNFLQVLAGLTGFLFMIFLSGYLFIYNTLTISIAKDIHYYGQLKTMGMTAGQLKMLIYLQALWNSALGIPVGLLAGALVAQKIVPQILSIVNPVLNAGEIAPVQPWIYLVAVVFALFTNFFGSRRPAAVLAGCSPVEALHYLAGRQKIGRREARKEKSREERVRKEAQTEDGEKEEVRKAEVQKEEVQKEEVRKAEVQKEEVQKAEVQKEEVRKEKVKKEEARERKSAFGNPLPIFNAGSHRGQRGFLPRMAAWNMFRDKGQACIILLSFTIAVTIFFLANVVVKQNDAKSILNAVSTRDLRILNETTMFEQKDLLSDEKIEEIRGLEGVKSVSAVTSCEIVVPYQEIYLTYMDSLHQSRYTPGNLEKDLESWKEDPEGPFWAPRLIGIDDIGFTLLNERLGGILDQERFEKGEIAAALNFIDLSPDQGLVGKKTEFYFPGQQEKPHYTIEIAALADPQFCPAYFGGGYLPSLIVSEAYAKQLSGTAFTELINITYDEAFLEATEQSVRSVFTGETQLSFSSKLEQYVDMKKSEDQVRVLGGSIGILMALLAILNYINMMAANIQNRSLEFAVLESIGMTVRQQKTVLSLEGIGYAVISCTLSLMAGIPLGYLIFNSLKQYEQLPYIIPWGYNLLLIFTIVLICIFVPIVLYQKMQRQGMIERLKGNAEM